MNSVPQIIASSYMPAFPSPEASFAAIHAASSAASAMTTCMYGAKFLIGMIAIMSALRMNMPMTFTGTPFSSGSIIFPLFERIRLVRSGMVAIMAASASSADATIAAVTTFSITIIYCFLPFPMFSISASLADSNASGIRSISSSLPARIGSNARTSPSCAFSSAPSGISASKNKSHVL